MRPFLRNLVLAGVGIAPTLGGPFPPAASQPGSDAIPAADPRFFLWATGAVIDRGPVEIGSPESAAASYGMDNSATGPADASPESPYPVVSLGDGGTATLEYAQPFGDVPGTDFAVFENGFVSTFLELAHVEISSDGVNFFRFPSISLTTSGGAIGEGGAVDPTNISNLAGKYLAGFGTPFDLAQLRHVSPLLDIQRVTHVRITDVVGTNDPNFATVDAQGNIVIDPYPTPYFSSGFDLDAVGAFSSTATTYAGWMLAQGITDTAVAADSNHDDVPNLVEYLTGSGRMKIDASSGSITLRFRRLSYRADANLRVEASMDLREWTNIAESNLGNAVTAVVTGISVTEAGDAAKQTTITLPAGSQWKFYRLAAEL